MISADIIILIPTYNGSSFIRFAIESVLQQTFKNFKLVVSDNCSTDKTIEIVNHYTTMDTRVVLVKGEQHLSMIKSWNKCLKLAKSLKAKYFMLLSHDDFLLSQYALAKAFEILENYPEVAAVYSHMQFVDKNGQLIMPRKFDSKGLIDSDTLAKKSILSGRNLFGIPILLRNDISIEISEQLNYVVDVDISIISAKHRKVYRISESLVAYRIHGSNATYGLFQQTAIQMQLLANKHDIFLNYFDYLKMNINIWFVIWQKKLFFFYLNKLRKYNR